MMKKALAAAILLMAAPLPALAGTAYSTSTTELGTLVDDPASKAVLEKYLPALVKSDQMDMARAMTLKQIQQYAPDDVTDKILADIDADLAKLGAK